MNHLANINKFWEFQKLGKSAALDVNNKTGEMVCLYTKSGAGADGNGTPPQTYSSDWTRICLSDKGVVRES